MTLPQKLISVAIIFLLSTGGIFAAECKNDEPQTYECYKKNVDDVCYKKGLSNEKSSWKPENMIVPRNNESEKYYPNNTPEDIQKKLDALKPGSQEDATQVQKDFADMDALARIGGMGTVKAAGNMYRQRMNQVYACAIIQARIALIEKLLSNPKTPLPEDMKELFKKEKEKLEQQNKDRKCIGPTKGDDYQTQKKKLLDSATVEYCNFQYYLDYMDSNMRKDLAKFMSGSESSNMQTTDQAAINIAKAETVIQTEKDRATEVFPKALAGYLEMNRTYIIHLLLNFIYTDYVTLRKNIRDFLTPISQLFEKVYNVQAKM